MLIKKSNCNNSLFHTTDNETKLTLKSKRFRAKLNSRFFPSMIPRYVKAKAGATKL